MLPSGTRLGPYEVVAPLGAGGMGEVYRARDTKLGREVAIKILPDAFARDPDRLMRFEREARTLASLNHPNIAQIFGLEQSGTTSALVMELVEGEDLSQRIARRPIPLDEALAIAQQIIEALDAAHEQGIIHRDLKPANIKVRADGAVKVLDFGLAKALRQEGQDPGHPAGADASALITVTGPARTMRGMIVGTAAYMSPEQAAGRVVDRRTDIWAFGCVFYEMVAGRRPFAGESGIEILAAVIKAEPDWAPLAGLPAGVQTLVRRCLQKDPRRRFHDVADVRIWIEEVLRGPVEARVEGRARRGVLPMAALACLAALSGGLAVAWLAPFGPATSPDSVVRFQITPSPDQPFTSRPSGTNLDISPDGSSIVYHAQVGDGYQLVRRHLDSLEASPIAGTDRAQNPTFSPDGTQIAFYSAGAIRTVAVAGGAPVTVCEISGALPMLAWSDSGEIFFTQPSQGLSRVPEKGGTPERMLAPDPRKNESGFFGLAALPRGAVTTTVLPVAGFGGRTRVAVLAKGATEFKTIVDDAVGGQYAAGYLLYRQARELRAAPFDLDRLEAAGDAFVLEAADMNQAAVARNGTFVYLLNDPAVIEPLRLAWLNRSGRLDRVIADQLTVARHVRLSPDGSRLAVTVGRLNFGEVWIYDLKGSAQPIKLTFRGGVNFPVWQPDGGTVFYRVETGLYSVVADGSVIEPQKVLDDASAGSPEEWSPDGASLLYQVINAKGGTDLFLFDRQSRQSRPWLQTPFNEGEARFSPDGRWVVYASDQSGRFEIWVRPFGHSAPPLRVSSDGGHEPRWSRDGKELFFQSGTRMMTASIESSGPLRAASPRVLFDGGFVPYEVDLRRTYDVAPDGRFVVIQRLQAPARQSLVVVMRALDGRDGTKAR